MLAALLGENKAGVGSLVQVCVFSFATRAHTRAREQVGHARPVLSICVLTRARESKWATPGLCYFRQHNDSQMRPLTFFPPSLPPSLSDICGRGAAKVKWEAKWAPKECEGWCDGVVVAISDGQLKNPNGRGVVRDGFHVVQYTGQSFSSHMCAGSNPQPLPLNHATHAHQSTHIPSNPYGTGG